LFLSRDDFKVKIKKDSIIKGSLKGLKDKGLRITNYEVWDRVGRPDTRERMNTLKDTTKGETYRLHICYASDPDQYPDSKPIDPSDKLA
jgi:hypothetical protein